MRRRPLILTTLVCTLFSPILSAQAEVPQEPAAHASVNLPQAPGSSTTPAQQPSVRTRWRYMYNSAHRHPITPRDVSMREAVQSLGVDKHRFVRCELRDGSHVIGGITGVHFAQFAVSQGIMNSRLINYSELKQPPEPVPAAGEHFVNGLEWTGVVAGSLAIAPLVVALFPLMAAGVISD